MSNQIPMDWGHQPSFKSADFLTLPCNAEAADMLQSWPDWPFPVIALVGPEGSGKTHLAYAWAEKAAAASFEGVEGLGDGATIFLDNADTAAVSDEDLFHLYNWIRETGGTLLLTAQKAPNRWDKTLPDLVSRLATIPVVTIGTPDEVMLQVVLQKHISDRQLKAEDKVLDYIITRMPRSYAAAKHLIEALDKETLARKRRITVPMVKEVMADIFDADA